MIKINVSINTDADEQYIARVFKRFMIEQFQEFEYEIVGKETIKEKQVK